MFQVAIYGKGGIGKSTVTANVSYILASRGNRVIQLGCDPKHDSTRLLIGGRSQVTVLDYLRSTPRSERSVDDVVAVGSGGVRCIEAGGPEPGVGCAGRGILTTFDFLESDASPAGDADYKLYDVLGDVVCGGFAVPLRKGYADAVYIVTSGEFMSLYAANNILKGPLNYDDGRPRVGGIILNRRGIACEVEYVRNFADGVGLPIVTVIERDPLFAEAESSGRTVSEAFPGTAPAESVARIADDIEARASGASALSFPRPLSDEAMDLVAKGIALEGGRHLLYSRIRNPVDDCLSLKSCSGIGAVLNAATVAGLHTVVHGPSSCAYMFCHYEDRNTLCHDVLGTGRSVWENVSCTGLDDSSSVFGGLEVLREHVRRRASMGDGCIAVISMCVPGIIGDDIVTACRELSDDLGVEVIPIPVDGIASGGGSEGSEAVTMAMVGLSEPYAEKDPGLINIMGEYRVRSAHMSHLDRSVEDLIRAAGFGINTVYPGRCTIGDIRRMGRAAFAVSSMDTVTNRPVYRRACEAMGVTLMRNPLPRGIDAIGSWLAEVSELTGRDLSGVLESAEAEYRAAIGPARRALEGKRAILVTRPAVDYGWLDRTLEDLGVDIVGRMESSRNRWAMGCDADGSEPYTTDMLERRVDSLAPDLVISDGFADIHVGAGLYQLKVPRPGVAGIADFADGLSRATRAPAVEGWRA